MNKHVTSNSTPIIERFSEATVVGLGVSGYSAARYLAKRGLLVKVVDTRPKPDLAERLQQEYPDIETHFGSLRTPLVKNAEVLVVSPGVSLSMPELVEAKEQGAIIVGDVELFLQENTSPLIAITGSNGKSTVTTLVGEMCAGAGLKPLVAGNIGEPVLNALTDDSDYDVAVLELSSFQLETTSSVPAESATILNISSDHMDRYTSMGDYVLAKARIMRGAKRAILSRHEPDLEQITNNADVVSFGLDQPNGSHSFGVVRKKTGRWLVKGDQPLMLLREVPLVGLHNVLNVLAAFALTDCLNLELKDLVDVVKSFEGLPHRMQTVGVKNGVTFVNDSKATNIGAASTALNNLEQSVYWIAGGEGKGANFDELAEALPETVEKAILIGRDAKLIEDAVKSKVSVVHADSLSHAVEIAASDAVEGSVVLLSPACASFDMFDGFEARGQAFVDAVNSLNVGGVGGKL